jgi:hypothetical protein
LNWKISVFFCFMSPYLAPGGLTNAFQPRRGISWGRGGSLPNPPSAANAS